MYQVSSSGTHEVLRTSERGHEVPKDCGIKVQRSDSFHLLQAQCSALKGLLKGHGLFKVPGLFCLFCLALLFQGSLVRQSRLRHNCNLTIEHCRAPVISPIQHCTACSVLDESMFKILKKKKVTMLTDASVYINAGWILFCNNAKIKHNVYQEITRI